MWDFLRFRHMLTPILIEIFFWIGAVLCIITGVVNFISGVDWRFSISVLILGPLVLRIFCEIVIIAFRMHEALESISHREGERPL